jgi:hypothetical protein
VIVAILAGLGIWWAVRTAKRAPFRKHMDAYVRAAGAPDPKRPPAPVKRLVVVDVEDKDVDGLHFDLPDGLRAQTPEEVTTVAQLRWNKTQVGTYTTGGGAYQWKCDVTVKDLETNAQIAQQSFAGSPPPQSFSGRRGESRTGDKPTEAVINFLKGLQAK